MLNPHEAFIKINQIYKELNANSIQCLLQELDSLQLKNDFSKLESYFEAKERLFNELSMAGKQLTESEKFSSTIKGLPISLKATGQGLHTNPPKLKTCDCAVETIRIAVSFEKNGFESSFRFI